MRLICPNCSAQYEVDASLVPDEGRDVQCSNCGHTWFELPPPPEDIVGAPAQGSDRVKTRMAPEHPGAKYQEQDSAPDGDGDGDAETRTAPASTATESDEDTRDATSAAVRAMAEASREKSEWDDDDDTSDDAAKDVTATSFKPRRPADAAALDVLREEAETELSKRRAPASETLETQSDMGLEHLQRRERPSRALQARMAQSRDATEDAGEKDYKAPERDLLPDIEEINSSLKPSAGKSPLSPTELAKQRRGFRWGFILMLLLAIAMIVAYAWAPAISQAMPAMEGRLIGYVDWVNGVRDWIDGLIVKATG